MVTDNDCRDGKNRQFTGLSTDTKPTENIGVNSLFLELDTGKVYYFTGTGWTQVVTA